MSLAVTFFPYGTQNALLTKLIKKKMHSDHWLPSSAQSRFVHLKKKKNSTKLITPHSEEKKHTKSVTGATELLICNILVLRCTT